MMTSLPALARALGGDVVGRQVLAPGPGHSRKDRSLSVMPSPSAPDGFVCFCHSPKDDPLEAKDYVRHRLGLPAFQPGCGFRRQGEAVVSTMAFARSLPAPRGRDESTTAPVFKQAEVDRRTAAALDIWNGSRDPRGTIVETYLASRSLELPDMVASEAIRFHPSCPWRDPDGSLIRVPTMVAAMKSIATEDIVAVHRTRLTPDGQKVDRRMLGPTAGAAIMLCPFSALEAGLTVGEGIETGLAAWTMGWSNTWAMGSAGAIASLPLITGVQSLVLLAEDDETNRRAVDTVADRYDAAGREVILVHSVHGNDLNDAIREVPAWK